QLRVLKTVLIRIIFKTQPSGECRAQTPTALVTLEDERDRLLEAREGNQSFRRGVIIEIDITHVRFRRTLWIFTVALVVVIDGRDIGTQKQTAKHVAAHGHIFALERRKD